MKFIVSLTAAISFTVGTSAVALTLPGARNVVYNSDHSEGTAFPGTVDSIASTTALAIRDDSHWYLYACFDPNFKGKCWTWGAEEGKCYNFYPEWINQISSMSADAGLAHECTIYEDLSCGGKKQTFSISGSADLRDQNFDDKVKSYMCKSTMIIPVTV
ncbi:hypothetical protein VTL71DRAFT_12986 [Oculimacula yallundae]|uniref:Uncharacterized protein n=1 Tax=Oculimacula yallundae TaxID=86028 RepID=A0ABR4CQU1_9HELO